MSIDNYLKSMLPSVPRETILSRVTDLENSLVNDTLPPLDAARKALEKHRFTDKFVVALAAKLERKLSTSARGNALTLIFRIMNLQPEHVRVVEEEISRHEGRVIARSAISYSTLQAMKILETLDFMAKYTRLFTIYTLAVETNAVRDQGAELRLSKAQLDYLKNRADDYVSALSLMNFGAGHLRKKIETMPRISVDEDNMREQLAVMGASALDPSGVMRDGIILQTVLPIRRAWADWQENKRLAAIEERKLLEALILDLRAALKNENDPSIQRHLEYSEKRMLELNKKIADLENV